MCPPRLLGSRDDPTPEDGFQATGGGAVVDAFGSVGSRKNGDAECTRSGLRLLRVEVAIPCCREKVIRFLAADKPLIVSLCDTNAYREEILANGFFHWHIDSKESEATLLVRLCRTEKLSNSPASLTAIVEPIEELVNIRPAALVEDKSMLFQLMPA